MKKKGLIIALSIVLSVIVATFGTLLAVKHFGPKSTNPEASQSTDDQKTDITVTITHKDGTKNKVEISTEAENLGDALFEKKLVLQNEHATGFYINIDGERADYNLDGAWWCFIKDGKMAEVGANDLPIADGDSFEIAYTPA